MDQLDVPALQTSWKDQFFLFEALASSHIRRFSLSLYIVAASESDEGLVFSGLLNIKASRGSIPPPWFPEYLVFY